MSLFSAINQERPYEQLLHKRFLFFSTFDMDKLGKILMQLYWKERR